ncbi:MAG: helix-turn-helix transcriptional regulator [Iphinoe sp. HA4291-MV1]|jgi:putative transcriptional regulator|nr:helix-turn-helix transcriptional regulator [Iphinoe sp. HA4291-MV1]
MELKMVSNLKKLMDSKNINIAQLSREIGVTENAIRGYVKNSFSRIDCEVAAKIGAYFNVSVGELFEFVEAK